MTDYSIFPKQDVLERLESAKRSGGLCKEAAAEIRRLRANNEKLSAEVVRLQRLVRCLLDNDPNDMTADAVTVLEAWRKEARAALEHVFFQSALEGKG